MKEKQMKPSIEFIMTNLKEANEILEELGNYRLANMCNSAIYELGMLQQENKQLKADYGNKAQVERDILKQENIDLKQKMIRILENIDVSYNDWKKWKDELKDSDK